MSNPYFNWPTSLSRFLRNTLVRAEAHNAALDQVSAGFDGLNSQLGRQIILPDDAGTREIVAAPGVRANKLLGFDPDGNLVVSSITNPANAVQRSGDTMTGPLLLQAPPQFNATTLAATTAFVQNSLGSLAGHVRYNANTTLTAADVGKNVTMTGGNAVLPLASSVPLGARIRITANGAPRTVSPQGSDTLASQNATFGPITLLTSGFMFVERNFAGDGWFQAEGDSALQYSPYFASTNTATGYQRFPGNIQECRGQFTASGTAGAPIAVTFPQAFARCDEVVLSVESPSTVIVSAWYDSKGTTGFNGHCNVTTLVSYIAKGTY